MIEFWLWFIFHSQIAWKQGGCWQRNLLSTISGMRSSWVWRVAAFRWDSPLRIDYTFLSMLSSRASSAFRGNRNSPWGP